MQRARVERPRHAALWRDVVERRGRVAGARRLGRRPLQRCARGARREGRRGVAVSVCPGPGQLRAGPPAGLSASRPENLHVVTALQRGTRVRGSLKRHALEDRRALPRLPGVPALLGPSVPLVSLSL
jgi:hypothetical protein